MLFRIPVPAQVPPLGVAQLFKLIGLAFSQTAFVGFVNAITGFGLTVIGINCVPHEIPLSNSSNCRSTIVGELTSFVLLIFKEKLKVPAPDKLIAELGMIPTF